MIPTLSDKKAEVLAAVIAETDITNASWAEALHWGINRVTPCVRELGEAGLVGCRNVAYPNRAHPTCPPASCTRHVSEDAG